MSSEFNDKNYSLKMDKTIQSFKKEISVIVTRFGINNFEIYEPIENTHQDQILKQSMIPAEISKKLLGYGTQNRY